MREIGVANLILNGILQYLLRSDNSYYYLGDRIILGETLQKPWHEIR